jgi:hypothetical protein
MIFNKAGKKSHLNFKWKNLSIETFQIYKYLGLQIHCSGKFKDTCTNLAQRASKGIFKIKRLLKGQVPPFSTCLHLFDSMIKPILCYGSDVWGAFLLTDAEDNIKKLVKSPQEKCHQNFLKFAIGLNRQTPLIGLYGESGRFPIIFSMIKSTLKYMKRLQNLDEESLLYQCYKENRLFKEKHSWWRNINYVLLNNNNPLNDIKKTIYQILT